MNTPHERSAQSDRAILRERFATAWTNRSDDVHTILDDLAQRAADEVEALDTLLDLLDRHGVARPALRKILIAADDVDDAEQSTLAAVGLHVTRFDGRARFTTWLHQVASNEAKMLIRARDRRPSDAVGDSTEIEQPFLARLSTLLADRDVIDRALDGLPDEFRRPLVLREVDGLGYDEIASVLDIPVGTVRSRISRARALLTSGLRV